MSVSLTFRTEVTFSGCVGVKSISKIDLCVICGSKVNFN